MEVVVGVGGGSVIAIVSPLLHGTDVQGLVPGVHGGGKILS